MRVKISLLPYQLNWFASGDQHHTSPHHAVMLVVQSESVENDDTSTFLLSHLDSGSPQLRVQLRSTEESVLVNDSWPRGSTQEQLWGSIWNPGSNIGKPFLLYFYFNAFSCPRPRLLLAQNWMWSWNLCLEQHSLASSSRLVAWTETSLVGRLRSERKIWTQDISIVSTNHKPRQPTLTVNPNLQSVSSGEPRQTLLEARLRYLQQ